MTSYRSLWVKTSQAEKKWLITFDWTLRFHFNRNRNDGSFIELTGNRTYTWNNCFATKPLSICHETTAQPPVTNWWTSSTIQTFNKGHHTLATSWNIFSISLLVQPVKRMSLSPATVALRSPSLARPRDESTAVVVGVPLGPWHATRDNPAPDGKKQETQSWKPKESSGSASWFGCGCIDDKWYISSSWTTTMQHNGKSMQHWDSSPPKNGDH